MAEGFVKPALSAEEWAEKSLTTFSDSDRVIASMPEDRHALAALCLYGQPFGFTQEDVDMLRWSALALEARIDRWNLLETARPPFLRALADRVAALLPPEGA